MGARNGETPWAARLRASLYPHARGPFGGIGQARDPIVDGVRRVREEQAADAFDSYRLCPRKGRAPNDGVNPTAANTGRMEFGSEQFGRKETRRSACCEFVNGPAAWMRKRVSLSAIVVSPTQSKNLGHLRPIHRPFHCAGRHAPPIGQKSLLSR